MLRVPGHRAVPACLVPVLAERTGGQQLAHDR